MLQLYLMLMFYVALKILVQLVVKSSVGSADSGELVNIFATICLLSFDNSKCFGLYRLREFDHIDVNSQVLKCDILILKWLEIPITMARAILA